MAPNWKPDEIALACKAYANATKNGVKGCDQDIKSFTADILQKLEILAEGIAPPGTHHHRGASVYTYLRDNVFNEIQKFNKCLRQVDVTKPTGCGDREILNMAVAIHLKQTNKVDYRFKDFDHKKWKLHAAYKVLKNLPKFQYNVRASPPPPTTQNGVARPEVPTVTDAAQGMLELSGTFDTVESSLSGNDYNNVPDAMISASARKNTRRGEGRDQCKKKEKEEHLKRKASAIESNMNTMKRIEEHAAKSAEKVVELQETITKKMKYSILSKAVTLSNDPIQKDRLTQKMLQIAEEIEL